MFKTNSILVNPLSLAAGVGEDRMFRSYQVAGQLLSDHWAAVDPERLETLHRAGADQILVVNGCYDQMGLMLRAAGLPFRQTLPETLNRDDLSAARIALVNCNSSFPMSAAQSLARFVERGGTLLTTDWAVQNVLEVTFPGFVRGNGRQTENRDEVVPVQATNEREPLTAGFFGSEKKPAWWLEPRSHPIERLSPKVEVLLQSPAMRQKYGNGSIAVRFPFGDGTVHHMVSHVYLQQAQVLDPLHERSALDFAGQFFADEKTKSRIRIEELLGNGFNFGSLGAATASLAFVSGIIVHGLKRRESETAFESVSRIFRMMMGDQPQSTSWQPTVHFVWDSHYNLYRYRMPPVAEVTLGRDASERLKGDKTLSRRHATIRRLQQGDSVGFALKAHKMVTIENRSGVRILDHDQEGWIEPGEKICLTDRIQFIFDPV